MIESAHPLVRQLYEIMKLRGVTARSVADRAGVNRETMRSWRTKSMPRVADLEACFNVLGLTLQPRRIRK